MYANNKGRKWKIIRSEEMVIYDDCRLAKQQLCVYRTQVDRRDRHLQMVIKRSVEKVQKM